MDEDVRISDKELNYLEDVDFLLTRHKINHKVNQLLLETEASLKDFIRSTDIVFPENIKLKAGKISKGENYRLLPYLILDYPRQFHRESVFALRTMFWWGHYYSVTMMLAGEALEVFREVLIEKADVLHQSDMYLYINEEDPWQHHLDEENYISLRSFASAEEIRTKLRDLPYIKLMSTLSLQEWEELPAFTLRFFKEILSVLSLYNEF